MLKITLKTDITSANAKPIARVISIVFFVIIPFVISSTFLFKTAIAGSAKTIVRPIIKLIGIIKKE